MVLGHCCHENLDHLYHSIIKWNTTCFPIAELSLNFSRIFFSLCSEFGWCLVPRCALWVPWVWTLIVAYLWCPDTRDTRQILLSTPGTVPAIALEGGSENIVICRAILLSRVSPVRPCHVDIVVTYIMIYRRPRHTEAPESLTAGNLLSQPSYNHWGGMPSRGRVADTGQVKNKFFILIYSHCWHQAACIHTENTGQMSFSHSELFPHYLRSFSLRWRNLNCSII